ncbi:hypothetical protein ADEAN_000061400 [Angomonas deanei]|uniref:Uncharacterized protein n=1 Tax=Angomonas deanei TaxID=59799 RepID=A0A7G2C070_9TRYP|nr:hypothetical protein ADEAN_000061400 [Angomonas deanei]
MSLEESLAVLEGLGRLGASETNTEASTSLLGQIWKERARMTDSEKARCRRALEGLKKTELSNDLLAFVSH